MKSTGQTLTLQLCCMQALVWVGLLITARPLRQRCMTCPIWAPKTAALSRWFPSCRRRLLSRELRRHPCSQQVPSFCRPLLLTLPLPPIPTKLPPVVLMHLPPTSWHHTLSAGGFQVVVDAFCPVSSVVPVLANRSLPSAGLRFLPIRSIR